DMFSQDPVCIDRGYGSVLPLKIAGRERLDDHAFIVRTPEYPNRLLRLCNQCLRYTQSGLRSPSELFHLMGCSHVASRMIDPPLYRHVCEESFDCLRPFIGNVRTFSRVALNRNSDFAGPTKPYC